MHILKAIAYVLLSFAVMLLLRQTMPLIALGFSAVHCIVGGLATFAYVIGMPFFAWAYASGEVERKQLPYCIAVSAICLIYWTTTPNVDVKEREWVVGMIEDYDATGESRFHCYEDAVEHARSLYKNRANWAKDDEGKFAECDVKISVFRFTPCLDWINNILGTQYGINSYTTSIRFIDNHEDPLSITDATLQAPLYDYYENQDR